MLNGLRLTLTTGTPVPSSDVTGATSLFLTPDASGYIALYSGTAWVARSTAQITKALGTLVDATNYDVYAFWTGSAVDLEFVAWTNDTTPASRTTQDGIGVKAGDATRRRIGAFRTTSTTTTEDSATRRFLYNGVGSRQVARNLLRVESTASWTWATPATWRQANAATANRVEVLCGDVCPVSVQVDCNASNSSGGTTSFVGVGVGSTTANSAQQLAHPQTAAAAVGRALARYTGSQLGYQVYNWIEYCASATATYYSTTSIGTVGISAQVSG